VQSHRVNPASFEKTTAILTHDPRVAVGRFGAALCTVDLAARALKAPSSAR
jgi:hypothetical protein